MNKDAGSGMWLFVTLRMESGEELPFFVDTGTTSTAVDKSLEPRLGKRLSTIKGQHYSEIIAGGVYSAPRIYLGNVPLRMGGTIVTLDLKPPSSSAGRPVMGILGMDCLCHYCIQLDFETGTLRFLDPDRLDTKSLGDAFPLTFPHGVTFTRCAGLLNGPSTDLLVGRTRTS
jgi:hypothetical protein